MANSGMSFEQTARIYSASSIVISACVLCVCVSWVCIVSMAKRQICHIWIELNPWHLFGVHMWFSRCCHPFDVSPHQPDDFQVFKQITHAHPGYARHCGKMKEINSGLCQAQTNSPSVLPTIGEEIRSSTSVDTDAQPSLSGNVSAFYSISLKPHQACWILRF